MNKQHYIKPATTVFAVQPLAILAGSGTFKLENGSYNIVVFLTICISYANNCFTL